MATNYISSHGMVWGEISQSGVTTSYGHDAQGSVVETFSNGGLVNTYRYKPFGGVLAKTGTAPDPRFLWNGGRGYRQTGLSFSGAYVRARHFAAETGIWTTCDPSWPSQPPYGYAKGSPTVRIDPSGLRCTVASTSNDPQLRCNTKLTMTSHPYADIQPDDRGTGWNINVFLDVGFVCSRICTPCPCPGSGILPQMMIQQWYHDGVIQKEPDWLDDGSQSCGPALLDGCTAVQQGRDTPGFSGNTWEPDVDCGVSLGHVKWEGESELEIHYVTICDPTTRFLKPPPGEPTSIYWGIHIYIIGVIPIAFVNQTSP